MQIESKDYNDSILEFQKYVCEMTQPILELQKHISEMMQPVIDNLQTTFSKVAEILGESFRPFRVIEKLGNAQYVFWD